MAPFWSRALSMSVPRNCIAVGALCTTLPARICPAVNASGLRREVPDKQPRTRELLRTLRLGTQRLPSHGEDRNFYFPGHAWCATTRSESWSVSAIYIMSARERSLRLYPLDVAVLDRDDCSANTAWA